MNAIQAFVTRVFNLKQPLDKRVIWVALGLLAVFGYLVFSGFTDGQSSGSSVSLDKRGGSGSDSFKASSQTMAKPSIYVHIVGFVRHPGLYRLDSGSRLVDAVFAADGFTAKADQASINLARVLTDGEQIFVAGIAASSGASSGFSGARSDGTAISGTALVNLNHADEAGIESLPGVGPTLAARIIDWRLANGGFKTKADLQKLSGIGDKLFAKLKDLVVL